jgi:type VI secretion system protein ImpJ
MKYPDISWEQGLFLQPHHLQQQQRAWAEQLTEHQQLTDALGYGLRSLTVNRDALQVNRLEFTHVTGRMRGGTIFVDQSFSLDLDQSLAGQSLGLGEKTDVYLCLLGESNEDCSRFRTKELEVADLFNQGDRQTLKVMEPVLQLRAIPHGVAHVDSLAGFEKLPLLRLQRKVGGGWEIDHDYAPPVLRIRAWDELKQLVEGVYHDLKVRCEELAEKAKNQTFEFSNGSDLEKLLLLSEINKAIAELVVWTGAESYHPQAAYASLVRIVGSLSIFRKADRRIKSIKDYNHEDMLPQFRWAKQEIKNLLFEVKDVQLRSARFVRWSHGMKAHIKNPEWISGPYDWYLSVMPSGMMPAPSGRDITTILFHRDVQFILHTGSEVERLFEKRTDGVRLEALRPPYPVGLPNGRYYFKIVKDPIRNIVQDELNLAMLVRKSALRGSETKEDDQLLRLRVGDKICNLKFELFFIPE